MISIQTDLSHSSKISQGIIKLLVSIENFKGIDRFGFSLELINAKSKLFRLSKRTQIKIDNFVDSPYGRTYITINPDPNGSIVYAVENIESRKDACYQDEQAWNPNNTCTMEQASAFQKKICIDKRKASREAISVLH